MVGFYRIYSPLFRGACDSRIMERMVANMKTWMLDFLLGGYLGISLSMFANITILDWQWWAIIVPTAILVTLRGTL